MKAIGRLLQFAGLTIPLLAIFLQLQQAIDVRAMLAMLVMSLAGFYLGRLIEGYSR